MGRKNTYGVDYSIPYEDNPRYQTLEIFKGMHTRCHNPNSGNYKWYGKKGITVCDRWARTPYGFENFIQDVGLRPDKSKSIDRKDPTGNYEPDNVEWASSVIQGMNRNLGPERGVKKHKNTGFYEAYIRLYGKKIHLGQSNDKEVALKIRHAADKVWEHLKEIGVIV
jgi:Tat protein secretion system quality control protein TatD with DNase activity